MRLRLRGSVAIVTGASGNIGSATARALVAQGVNVVLAALPDALLDEVAAGLSRQHVPALVIPTDVTKRDQVDTLVAKTLAAFGRIDVLANIAGIGSGPSFCETSPEELEQVLAVNLLGSAYAMHAVLPAMKAQGGGCIVNIGSIAGETGVMGIYSASKFGLRGLTDSIRREVRRYNISVTLIEPGFVRSSMNPMMGDNLPGPEIVADAIIAAIHHPRRVRIIPAGYRFAVALTKLFPALTDAIFSNPRVQERMNRDTRAARNGSATNAEQKS